MSSYSLCVLNKKMQLHKIFFIVNVHFIIIYKRHLLDLYDLKLSRLVDCLVRLTIGIFKESVDDFLRVELLGVLYEK